jgi:hypothetical protein
MTEPYEDNRYYCDEQDFGGAVKNYTKVLPRYNYSRYVARFRALADHHRLSRNQRPKLGQKEFDSFMRKLGDTLVAVGEDRFLEDPKTVKLASRLLILGLLDADWF